MPDFVCAKCYKPAIEIGGFCSKGYMCKICANALPSRRTFVDSLPVNRQCSPKVTHSKSDNTFLEEQLKLFKQEQETPERIKQEWALFIKKYFNGKP